MIEPWPCPPSQALTGIYRLSMGAAGWHICLDVLGHALSGTPLGRIVGPEVMIYHVGTPGHERKPRD